MPLNRTGDRRPRAAVYTARGDGLFTQIALRAVNDAARAIVEGQALLKRYGPDLAAAQLSAQRALAAMPMTIEGPIYYFPQECCPCRCS